MADDLQKSWDRLMGTTPKQPSILWLALGALLGVIMQVGPGAAAGFAGWSPWVAVAWGVVVAFYATVIKSSIGRGMISGTLPPHWLSAFFIAFPVSAAVFSGLNYAAYWLASWLSR